MWPQATRSPVRQQLRRYQPALAGFEQIFGDPVIAVSDFVFSAGACVRLINLEEQRPGLFASGAV